jgi:hypothetical protein
MDLQPHDNLETFNFMIFNARIAYLSTLEFGGSTPNILFHEKINTGIGYYRI